MFQTPWRLSGQVEQMKKLFEDIMAKDPASFFMEENEETFRGALGGCNFGR